MTINSKPLTYEFPDFNPRQRLREMILYIAQRSMFDARFGKTKLVKLLYFADFTSFRETGRPITGHQYVKLPNGPFPDHFETLLAEMVAEGDLVIDEVPMSAQLKPRYRFIPQRAANLDLFTGKNIAVVDSVMMEFRRDTGKSIAEASHGLAWKTTRDNQPIPYEASLLSDESPTQEDYDHIRRLVEKYGVQP
jgi:hypothetical protein